MSCDQNGDTLAYTCYASFAAAPTITYDVVITPDGKSYLVTGHTTAEATPSPSVSDEASAGTKTSAMPGGWPEAPQYGPAFRFAAVAPPENCGSEGWLVSR